MELVPQVLRIVKMVAGLQETIRTNKQQANALIERVRNLEPGLRRLESSGKADGVRSSLQGLLDTLKAAQALLQSFADKNWLSRAATAGTSRKQFDELHTAMDRHILDLQLDLAISSKLDLEAAAEADRVALAAALSDLNDNQSKLSKMVESGAEKQADHSEAVQAALFDIKNQLLNLAKPASEPSTSAANRELLKRISWSDIELIGKPIGSGAFGDVYYGEWIGTPVAVKVMRDVTPAAIADFRGEADTIGGLNHPQVIKLYGMVDADDKLALVFEYMDGGSLFDMLHKNKLLLSFQAVVKMASLIARAMIYLHASDVVHRDLKSPNVLINRNWDLRVADFGLAKSASAGDKMRTTLGSPSWMAPEVLQSKEYDRSVDVYSFGILLWELFTSQVPYQGMQSLQIAMKVSSEGLRPDVPADMPPKYRSLMQRCWSEDPSARPTFDTVLKDLRALDESPLMPVSAVMDSRQFSRWRNADDTNKPKVNSTAPDVAPSPSMIAASPSERRRRRSSSSKRRGPSKSELSKKVYSFSRNGAAFEQVEDNHSRIIYPPDTPFELIRRVIAAFLQANDMDVNLSESTMLRARRLSGGGGVFGGKPKPVLTIEASNSLNRRRGAQQLDIRTTAKTPALLEEAHNLLSQVFATVKGIVELLIDAGKRGENLSITISLG